MVFSDDTIWITARIVATEALIVAYEAAILALSGGMQSYSIDSGQTRQSVTRADLGSLRMQLSELETRRDMYKARLNGSGFVGRPTW